MVGALQLVDPAICPLEAEQANPPSGAWSATGRVPPPRFGVPPVAAPVDLVFGCTTSGQSMRAQSVLQAFNVPQISPWATSPSLSDKGAYPFFSRVVPTDFAQTGALAGLLTRVVGVNRVSLIHGAGSYGKFGGAAFVERANQQGVELCSVQQLPQSADAIPASVRSVIRAGCRAVVLFMQKTAFAPVLAEFARHEDWGPQSSTVFLMSGSVTSMALSDCDRYFVDNGVTSASGVTCRQMLVGSLATSPSYGAGRPQYERFRARWRAQASVRGLSPCGGGATDDDGRPLWLRDNGVPDATEPTCIADVMSKDFKDYSTKVSGIPLSYDMVLAVAHALHALLEGKQRAPESISGASLLGALRAVHFEGVTGDVGFDSKGERTNSARHEFYGIVALRSRAGSCF